MALSNWDTLAVNQDGDPVAGTLVSPMGVEVAIYKNWLYVRDAKAWREGGAYVADTVMEIREGVIRYLDVDIHAARGPQEGVYAVVEARPPRVPLVEACEACGAKAGSRHHVWGCAVEPRIVMIGCGVYGFAERGDDGEGGGDATWVGVTPESVAFLRAWINHADDKVLDLPMREGAEAIIAKGRERGEEWAIEDGVIRHRYKDYRFAEHIRRIPLDKSLRVNQGDLYFANRIEGLDPQATPPGEAPAPHIDRIIEAWKRT